MAIDLLEPEFKEPYLNWQKNPNPDNTNVLLKKINPVITSAMRSYGAGGSPTLKSRAKIIALDAMQRYDPSQAKLRTHLMVQLQGLRRYAAREQQILYLPEQVGLDLTHLHEAENNLKDQLGRDPSDLELADATGLSLKRLSYIRQAKPAYAESLFHKPGDEGEELYTPPVVTPNSNRDVHWQEFVYHDLHPIDQLIMEHTLGLHNKQILANQDIAKKLNLSPGAVSQRKAKIQSKLDLRDTLGIL